MWCCRCSRAGPRYLVPKIPFQADSPVFLLTASNSGLSLSIVQKKLICLLALLGSAFAADNALLRNGFAIRHERREILENGATTRLYVSANGDFIDVHSADIATFETAPAELTPVVAMPIQ